MIFTFKHWFPTSAVLALLVAMQSAAHAQDIEAGRAKAQACAACHGPGGNSENGLYPTLAGQTWRYLYIQLKDFKEGRRNDPVMSAMAQPLSRQDMIDIANYYAAQPLKPTDFKADETKVRLGKAKTDETLCTMCHLEKFAGQNETPRVAGQRFEYIVKQLKDFKARVRTNEGGSMIPVARTLSEADIENVAHYIANLR